MSLRIWGIFFLRDTCAHYYYYYYFIFAFIIIIIIIIIIITLVASSGKRNATVWRPSLRPSVCMSVPFFLAVMEHGAYSTWLTRGQHATRLAYISVRVLRGRTYLLLWSFSSSLWGAPSSRIVTDCSRSVRTCVCLSLRKQRIAITGRTERLFKVTCSCVRCKRRVAISLK